MPCLPSKNNGHFCSLGLHHHDWNSESQDNRANTFLLHHLNARFLHLIQNGGSPTCFPKFTHFTRCAMFILLVSCNWTHFAYKDKIGPVHLHLIAKVKSHTTSLYPLTHYTWLCLPCHPSRCKEDKLQDSSVDWCPGERMNIKQLGSNTDVQFLSKHLNNL